PYEDPPHSLHERRRPAEEEHAAFDLRDVLRDELAADMPPCPRPVRIRLGKQHLILEILQASAKFFEFLTESHVVAGSNAIQKGGLRIETEIVEIAEHGHHRRDTAAGRQQHDFLVLRRQTELPERS